MRPVRGVIVAAVLLAAAAPAWAQTKAKAENVPIIPHSSVPDFFKLPPDLYFGEGIGIATNSKGNIYTTETYTGKRLQKFINRGMRAVPARQGAPWPTRPTN